MLGVLGFEIGEEKVKKSKKNETYLLNLPLHVSGESPGWARNEAGEAPASYDNFLNIPGESPGWVLTNLARRQHLQRDTTRLASR